MNISGVKSPQKRLEVAELSSLLIRGYGTNNLYPQNLSAVIAASGTASLCVRRLARFIEGRGFEDANLYNYIVNSSGETMDALLKKLSYDIARYDGIAIHVNYNAIGQIVDCTHVPFENCRLGYDDSVGYTGKIAVHPDWTGSSKRRGKAIKVSKEVIDYIDVFNPNPKIVAAQIATAEGIENYKGQVLYCSTYGANIYPIPRADAIVTDMSTDEGLTNIRCRNARNNCLPAGMLVKEKATQEEDQAFDAAFAEFQGDTKSNNIISVTVDKLSEQSAPVFVPFKAANFDKEFDKTTAEVIENIYAQFEQEKFYRVRSGSLGFSSDIAADLMNDYSETLYSEQLLIERAFTSIFSHWRELVSNNFAVRPLTKAKENATPNHQNPNQ